MKYLLPCSCGRKIVVQTSQAGDRVRCTCGEERDVPTMIDITRLEPVVEDSPSEASGSWGTRERLMLVGSFVIAIGLCVAAFYVAFRRPTALDFQELAPSEAMEVYQIFRDGGPGGRLLPRDVYDLIVARQFKWGMILAGLITAIGVIVTGISLCCSGRGGRRRPVTPAGPPR
jgi:hypothetical protein